MTSNENMISEKKAQSFINAIIRQRDEQSNARAQVEVAFDEMKDELEKAKIEIAQLNEQLQSYKNLIEELKGEK